MNNLLSAQFWFNTSPVPLIPQTANLLLGLLGLLVVLAIISYVLRSKKGFYSRFWSKLGNFFLSNSLIGGALWFINTELVPFLSARFWFLLWIAGMMVWLAFIINFAKSLPNKKKEFEEKKKFQKYIP
jgi:hypothetical protein